MTVFDFIKNKGKSVSMRNYLHFKKHIHQSLGKIKINDRS